MGRVSELRALLLATPAQTRPREPPLLTARQTECIHLLVKGCTDQEIAAELSISRWTVRFHLDSARGRFNARSRSHMSALAVCTGVALP
jgi:DNA-binding CsgD family transcriptional regulator